MVSEIVGLIVFLLIFGLSVFLLWQRFKSMRKEDGMIDIRQLHKFMMKFMILFFVIVIVSAILLISLRHLVF